MTRLLIYSPSQHAQFLLRRRLWRFASVAEWAVIMKRSVAETGDHGMLLYAPVRAALFCGLAFL